MKNKKMRSFLFMAFIMPALVITSCKKDKENSFAFNTSKGVFIVDQGAYGKVNAGISFLERTSKTMTNDVFNKINGRNLGDIAQSMGEANGKYYIVVNNSNKIEVVDKYSFKSAGIVKGVNQPQYFLAINNTKAYVTEWGNGDGGKVDVINLTNNTVMKTIPVGQGAEHLILANNKIYVANSGGFSYEKTLSVINTTTDNVDTTFEVGDNPNSLAIDSNGKLWALCGGKGKPDYTGFETNGSLVRINPMTNAIEQTIQLATPYSSTNNLNVSPSGNTLYYCIDGKVYKQSISSSVAEQIPVLNKNYNAIFIDKESNYFYAADAKNYTDKGWVIRYDLNFTPIDSFEVGIAPGFFYAN
jgi:YVTN family beta-propeller protein